MASVFAPGSNGTLKAVTLPSALFEMARVLDAAENSRNGANPGIAPQQRIAVSVDFGTRVAAIAATLPVAFTLDNNGKMVVDASDYLGAPYSEFVPGGGDLKSVDAPSAFLEVAQLVAANEKSKPADNQPNNVQISIDAETGTATVTANLPISTSGSTNGSIVISAVDYL